MASSVPHLHTYATNNSLPTTTMCRMAVSHNCVLLSTGSTDTTIHAQPSASVHTSCLWNEQHRTKCVFCHLRKQPSVQIQESCGGIFAFMVSQRKATCECLPLTLQYKPPHCIWEPSGRVLWVAWGKGLAAIYYTLLKQIHLKSRIRGEFTKAGEACLTHTHAHAHIFGQWTSWFPPDWLISFVYWATFVIGLYLDYNLFKGFPQK